jgi:hypothetical protein
VRGEQLPAATHTSLYELSTADGATVTGTLRSVPGHPQWSASCTRDRT